MCVCIKRAFERVSFEIKRGFDENGRREPYKHGYNWLAEWLWSVTPGGNIGRSTREEHAVRAPAGFC